MSTDLLTDQDFRRVVAAMEADFDATVGIARLTPIQQARQRIAERNN